MGGSVWRLVGINRGRREKQRVASIGVYLKGRDCPDLWELEEATFRGGVCSAVKVVCVYIYIFICIYIYLYLYLYRHTHYTCTLYLIHMREIGER